MKQPQQLSDGSTLMDVPLLPMAAPLSDTELLYTYIYIYIYIGITRCLRDINNNINMYKM